MTEGRRKQKGRKRKEHDVDRVFQTGKKQRMGRVAVDN